jgi:hypothetical protein
MSEFYENIASYLDDTLSESQKKDFETALQNDMELREEVAKEKAYRAVQYQITKEDLRKRLQQINQTNNTKETPIVSIFSWRKYAIAASVIGLIFVSYYLFFTQKTIDYQQLAKANNIEFPIPNIQGASNEKENLKNIYKAIESKKYDSALALFKQLSPEERSEEVQFFQAYTLLQNGNFNEAKAQFDDIKDGQYKYAADWYSAIAMLSQNQNAEQQLEKIKNTPNHTYQKKAVLLLEEMK